MLPLRLLLRRYERYLKTNRCRRKGRNTPTDGSKLFRKRFLRLISSPLTQRSQAQNFNVTFCDLVRKETFVIRDSHSYIIWHRHRPIPELILLKQDYS
jgi:hypothetical protein